MNNEDGDWRAEGTHRGLINGGSQAQRMDVN